PEAGSRGPGLTARARGAHGEQGVPVPGRAAPAPDRAAQPVASPLMLQLYDLAGIYFRALYAVPSSITGPDGAPTGAIRGSLDILARVIAHARPTRGVACLDVDWRPAWRVELVPTYKAHRVAVTETATQGAAEGAGDPLGGELG